MGKTQFTTLAMLALFAVSACSSGNGLRDFRSPSDGPDEFSVVPSRPLEAPPSLNDLPAPTVGGSNRADPAPELEAVAALGGRSVSGGVPASDGALVSYASRRGVDPDIRSALAAEDRAFRARRSRLTGPFTRRGSRYYAAYASQSLDAQAELERFRASGVRVPTAPPR